MDCTSNCLVCSSHEPALDLRALVSGMGNLRHPDRREFLRTNTESQCSSHCVLGRCFDMARICMSVHCLCNMEHVKLNTALRLLWVSVVPVIGILLDEWTKIAVPVRI